MPAVRSAGLWYQTQMMVPLDDYQGEGDYGFGRLFGWCEDKYGVSWQFVLTE